MFSLESKEFAENLDPEGRSGAEGVSSGIAGDGLESTLSKPSMGRNFCAIAAPPPEDEASEQPSVGNTGARKFADVRGTSPANVIISSTVLVVA